MTQFDFDTALSRQQTNCEKYDGRLAKFGREDVIPLWVADMDFAAPPAVQEALSARLAHPIFGYSFAPEALYQALYSWFAKRHNWEINPAQVMLTPGIVPSLFASIQALTEKGDGILVPTPIYPPFFAAVKQSERRLLACPLQHEQNHYQLDFAALEQLAPQAKMLLLCNPHNPVGRVWNQHELEQLIALALKHQLIIVSDDIHCDLVLTAKAKYVPLATLAPPELRLVTAVSPSKSFNIPGLNLAAAVVSHPADKQALQRVFGRLSVNPYNPLNMTAFTAAYAQGEAWLEALIKYLSANCDSVLTALAASKIHCQRPEATALMWLDCRQLNLTPAELQQFFVMQAGLGLNDGPSFDPYHQGGDGFMRLNLGTQQSLLKQALSQLNDALAALG